MKREDLERVVEVARAAANDAAKLILPAFRQRMNVEHKGAIDLVTEYDRKSEASIRAHLGAELPYAIVGEEAGGAPVDGVALYVDPIDGTTNFVHGHPFWCISIGLVEHGIPVAGLVLAPVLGVEWSGWVTSDLPEEGGERASIRRDLGNAFVSPNEAPCVPSQVRVIPEAYLATGFPYDRRTSEDDNFAAFFAIKKECLGVRRCGSAAMDVCLVADGTYDGYWERKVNVWDVAAGAAIARAAGCLVTDFAGGSDYLGSRRILVTNGAALNAALQTRLA